MKQENLLPVTSYHYRNVFVALDPLFQNKL
jgi:hypothetical protein